MQLNWLQALALCLLGCQHQTAETQTLTAKDMMKLKRLETVIDTPTGPTRQIEFKNTITDEKHTYRSFGFSSRLC